MVQDHRKLQEHKHCRKHHRRKWRFEMLLPRLLAAFSTRSPCWHVRVRKAVSFNYRSQELGICVKHAIEKMCTLITHLCIYIYIYFICDIYPSATCLCLSRAYLILSRYQQYTSVGMGVCVTSVSKFQPEVCSLCRLATFCSNYWMCLLAVNAMMLHWLYGTIMYSHPVGAP